jgi:hypothetical protein
VNVPPISAASRALRGVIDMEHGSRCLKGASRDGTWEAKHFGAAIAVFDWLYCILERLLEAYSLLLEAYYFFGTQPNFLLARSNFAHRSFDNVS